MTEFIGDPDDVDRLAVETTAGLLNKFDANNYTGFDNFDVRFIYNDCEKEYDAAPFMRLVREYRKTFESGTVIKYGLLKARVTPRIEGILFSMHFEFLEQHWDIEGCLEWLTTEAGSRWNWLFIELLNCRKGYSHPNNIQSWTRGQKIIS